MAKSSSSNKQARQVERAARAERAAAAIRERQARERRRRNLSIAGVVVAIALVVAIGVWYSTRSDNSASVAAAAPPPGSDHGLTIGPGTAPHKVVIYEDFLCPYCGELEKQSHTQLEALADAGKVQVEYRPFAFLTRLGDYSERSTESFASVLQQSGDEVALEYHDLLFADQPDEKGPFPSDGDLEKLMTQAGADAATISDFKAGNGETWAQEATDSANDVGVHSTPTIILDGTAFQDGSTVDQLAANLLKALQ